MSNALLLRKISKIAREGIKSAHIPLVLVKIFRYINSMALTAEDKYQYWLSYAHNDIDTAEVMLHSGRWFYAVFMCQQAIEKLVKGLYILYVDDNVPRLHDINTIFSRFSDKLPESLTDDQAMLFDTLSQFYLRSRYPDYTSALASTTNSVMAQSTFEKSKEAYQWLLTMKPRCE